MSILVHDFLFRHNIKLTPNEETLVSEQFSDQDVIMYSIGHKLYAFDKNRSIAVVHEYVEDTLFFKVHYYYDENIILTYSDCLTFVKVKFDNGQIPKTQMNSLLNNLKHNFFHNYYRQLDFEVAEKVTKALELDGSFRVSTFISQNNEKGLISYIDIYNHNIQKTTTIYIKDSDIFKVNDSIVYETDQLVSFVKKYFNITVFSQYDQVNENNQFIKISGTNYTGDFTYNLDKECYEGFFIELIKDENEHYAQTTTAYSIPVANRDIVSFLNYLIDVFLIKYPKYTFLHYLSENGILPDDGKIDKEHVELLRMMII